MSLIVSDLTKSFGRFPALKSVSLSAEPGEFLALLGPSGSGKTTLLRVLAGLEAPDAGRVALDGEDFLALSARERRVGMVFQSYALFRHMSVAENIAFGLKVRPGRERPSAAEIKARVASLLDLVQLPGLDKRRPAQLSGGQRQRVALARALAVEPRLLLLDEPFGALDAKVRQELRRQLREIHEATGVTTVFVTHDQDEAMALADRVAVLNRGEIEQVGRPDTLERAPASRFVFEFLGETNALPCRREGARAVFDGYAAEVAGGDAPNGPADALFRPEAVALDLNPDGPGEPGTILALTRQGSRLKLEVRLGGGLLLHAETDRAREADFAPGQTVRARPLRVFAFARNGPSQAQ